ncbi:DUF397 domain-containing protein [Actinomadura rupiterrae]|uniref:DUF397 domain-containing protein n=1 Tax=Actinomadura rupiterrae TaxID=559627 RepID=UPI0020A5ECED|nr:DUF397 domain-containing protein [Actinomadura rupiterrae]MCP2336032.1 hypothetical protein [Actinomadura rupiterrae]
MPTWRKSSYSDAGGQNCVELGDLEAGVIGVRDSKAPDAGHLTIAADELGLLLRRVRRDETGPGGR